MRRVAVLGLGVSGLSVIRFLARASKSTKILAFDSRNLNLEKLEQEYPEVDFYTGDFSKYTNDILSVETIFLSPGLDPKLEIIEQAKLAKIKISSDIELFCENNTKPVIAITGTNGKSTTTKLCGHILEEHNVKVGIGGNYGVPALDLLEQDADLFVLELSSFQIDLLDDDIKFLSAVVLNITPDHLDRYSNFEEYKKSKLRLYNMASNKIIDVSKKHLGGYKNQYVYNSSNNSINGDDYSEAFDDCLHLIVDNALASIAIANTFLPLDKKVIKRAFGTFEGLMHRCQVIEALGRVWINDSKATNPEASLSALEFCKNLTNTGDIHIILGGLTKGANISELCKVVPYKCQSAILIGKAGKEFYNLLKDNINCELVPSMEDAVNIAKQLSKPKDIILLSPAAASFDMFKNFEHRGNCFIDCIKSLREKDTQKNEARKTGII